MVEVIQRKVAIMQFYKSLRQAVNNQTILSCYFKALRGCMGTIILQNIKLKMITPQIFLNPLALCKVRATLYMCSDTNKHL